MSISLWSIIWECVGTDIERKEQNVWLEAITFLVENEVIPTLRKKNYSAHYKETCNEYGYSRYELFISVSQSKAESHGCGVWV